MIKPELVEYVEELKAYITADGGIDVFESGLGDAVARQYSVA